MDALRSEPGTQALGSELLTTLQQMEQTCSALLATPHTQKAKQIGLLQQINVLDGRLSRGIAESRLFAEKQARIEELVSKIQNWDTRWRSDIATAEANRRELEILIKVAEQSKGLRQASKPPPSTQSLLGLARQLSKYTAAPPTATNGSAFSAYDVDVRALLGKGGVLPYPSEEVMRRGLIGTLDRQTGMPTDDARPTNTIEAGEDQSQKKTQRAHAYDQMRQPMQPYQNQQPQEEAFDLDLNSSDLDED